MYVLVEDILKERIAPNLRATTPFKTVTVHEVKTVSRHESPKPPATSADQTAIPVATPPILTSLPRLPTPPLPPAPTPPKEPTPPPATLPSEQPTSPSPEQNLPSLPNSPPP